MKACGFPVCCLGKKKKKREREKNYMWRWGASGQSGAKRKKDENKKTHKGIFLSNEDVQVSLLYRLKRVQHPKEQDQRSQSVKHGPNVNPVFDLCTMVLNTATPLQLLEAKGFWSAHK